MIIGPKEKLAWTKESMVSDPTRGLDFYAEHLHLSEQELAGKRVLDLGSGKEAALARDIARRPGLEGTRVVSFSPHFSMAIDRADVKRAGQAATAVAGIAQQLPFKNEKFDYVLSVWAVPFHLRGERITESEEQVQKALAEAWRVLVPGGEMRLYPFITTDVASLEAVLSANGIQDSEYSIEPENVLVLKKKRQASSVAQAA